MRRLFVGDALEIVGAGLLIAAAVAIGFVFHRAALSVVLGLAAAGAGAVYFAHVFQDVYIPLKRRRRDGHEPVEAGRAEVRWTCAVCDKGRDADHSGCSETTARSAATMRH